MNAPHKAERGLAAGLIAEAIRVHGTALALALRSAHVRGIPLADTVVVLMFTGPGPTEHLPALMAVHRARAASAACTTIGAFPELQTRADPHFVRFMCWVPIDGVHVPCLADVHAGAFEGELPVVGPPAVGAL
jgi:hypothetical protein